MNLLEQYLQEEKKKKKKKLPKTAGQFFIRNFGYYSNNYSDNSGKNEPVTQTAEPSGGEGGGGGE